MKFLSILFKPIHYFWRFCRSRPVKEPYAAAAMGTYMSLEEMKSTFAGMFKEPSGMKREATPEPQVSQVNCGYSYRRHYWGGRCYYRRGFSNRYFRNYPGSGI